MRNFTPQAVRLIWTAIPLTIVAAIGASVVLAQSAPPGGAGAAAPQAMPPATQPVKLLEPKPIIPGAKVVTLWPEGSPKLRAARGYDQPETFHRTDGQPNRVQWVNNIHNPSIELHLAPPDKANGSAIILAAGGGNTTENVGTEGTDIAVWLNTLGISAIIERYRIQPYNAGVDGLADTQRSFKVVRAHAKEWGIDPKKIGIMGFSAGGEQAIRVAMKYDKGNPNDPDPIEHESSRPDYVVLIYAGYGGALTVPQDAPPVFAVCAGIGDRSHSSQTMDFTYAWLLANKPVEIHIYSTGVHADGIKPRNGIPFGTWEFRFVDWARDQGLMNTEGKHEPAREADESAAMQKKAEDSYKK